MFVEFSGIDIDVNDHSARIIAFITAASAFLCSSMYSQDKESVVYCQQRIKQSLFSNMSREEMLGTIGFEIGYEITHCFDLLGSQYDETGVFRDWWTDADRAAFQRRSEKLIRYYDSLRPLKDGSAYSGARVQTEAVADLGAMACMLRMAAKISGFDYDAFFRAFVKPFCMKSPENTVEDAACMDEHPLFHLRVNVVAAQFPEFQ